VPAGLLAAALPAVAAAVAALRSAARVFLGLADLAVLVAVAAAVAVRRRARAAGTTAALMADGGVRGSDGLGNSVSLSHRNVLGPGTTGRTTENSPA
jgi:hypothetical protein